MTSNVKQQYAGSDFVGGSAGVTRAIETLFRPSDIAVGPDGALYVSDWIDARVGGHQDLDNDAVGRDLPDRAEGLRVESPDIRPRHHRRSDHGASFAGDERSRHRLQGLKARGAAAIDPVAALLEDPNPLHSRARDLPSLSARARRPEARGVAGVADRSGDAHRRLPCHAAGGSRRAAGRGEARQGHGSRRPPRGGAVAARPAGGEVAPHPRRDRAGLRRQRSQLPGSVGHRRHRKEAALYDRLRSEPGIKDVRSAGRRLSRGWRGGCTCPRRCPIFSPAHIRRSCRSRTGAWRWTRSRSSMIRPRRRRCWRSPSRTVP